MLLGRGTLSNFVNSDAHVSTWRCPMNTVHYIHTSLWKYVRYSGLRSGEIRQWHFPTSSDFSFGNVCNHCPINLHVCFAVHVCFVTWCPGSESECGSINLVNLVALTLNQPRTHKCVQSLHKSVWICMEVIIVGPNTLYINFCLFN